MCGTSIHVTPEVVDDQDSPAGTIECRFADRTPCPVHCTLFHILQIYQQRSPNMSTNHVHTIFVNQIVKCTQISI